MAKTELGSVVAVHVWPPSLLQAAAEGPIATHVVEVPQDTLSIIESTPDGGVALDQVSPPSLDVSMVGAFVALGPTATHSVVEGHETACAPAPAGTVAGFHVAPPSALTRMGEGPSEATTHREPDAHDTSDNRSLSVSAVQCAPPSVV
jgi:hypothetical protein